MRYCNDSVRRQDRLLEEARAVEILREGEYGFLSMATDEGGYGVPINYAVCGNIIYFHCAPEGRKMQAVMKNPSVSFCVVGHKRIVAEEFTTEYESVIASGVARVVESDEERRQALRLIVEKYSPEHLEQGLQAIERSVHRTAVVAIEVERLTGKTKMMR
jgi:nitroimidazol reductase NimA-like FMN-containing flavoprotein (pyridoxamine 5'-phosphate oxidase superfamily)